MKRFSFFLQILGMVVFWAHSAFAQVTTGTISGTVKDSSGAVLPGAKIVILNEDTGIARDVIADSTGRYTATSLSLGGYRISASLEGFQTAVRSGIVLTVGREAVVDIQLNVGAVSQTVEVAGEAPLIQTTEATVGYLVADQSIRDLPLNGRDVSQLILLNPGVVSAVNSTASSGTVGYGKRISISGARGEDNAYLLDGSYINDFGRHIPAGPSGALLGAETVREFEVLTNSFTAQYSRALGGVFNAVSKSGTNDWHGSVYEFLRNSALDARDFFDVDKLPFRRNQFGGSVSGPLARNRTFLFVAIEEMHDDLTYTQINNVPDENARRGILPSGTVQVVPAVVPFLRFFPLPTPGGRRFNDGTAEFIFPASQPTTEHFGQGRVDHQFSSSDALFLRFTGSNSNRISVADYPGNSGDDNLNSRLLTLSETHIISSAALNAFRFSFNRVAPVSSTAGFPAVPEVISVPGQALAGIAPGNNITGYNTNLTPKIQFLTNRFNGADDVSRTFGRHALKFGGTLERLQFNVDQPNRPNGTWTFSSLQTFLQGVPVTYRGTPPQASSGSVRGMRQWFYGLYMQDDWRVLPHLSLNLGVRWDRSSVPTEVNGLIVNIHHREDPAPTVGGDFWKPTGGNWAPRFGFAWSPFASEKTSVRGGIGLYYVPTDPGIWFRAMARTAPLSPEFTIPNPRAFPDALAAIRAFSTTSFGTVYVFSYENMRTPHTVQYNLNVQEQLDKNSVLTVGYVGSRGMNLVSLKNWNMPLAAYNGNSMEFAANATLYNPSYTCICYYNDDTNFWYNALTVAYQRRLSAGFQAQVSYTFAKNIDENDGNNTSRNVSSNDFPALKYTYDRAVNRGLSGYGVPMALVTNYSYQLPFGKGWSGLPGRLAGGWELSGIFTAQRGQPFTVLAGVPAPLAPFLGGATGNGSRSPNSVAGRSMSSIILGGVNQYFDPTAFTPPGPRELGNTGRNTLIGPGLVRWDFSLLKNTVFKERYNLQFRAELFNVFNHPNFAGPAATVSNNVLFTASGSRVGSATAIANTLRGNWRQIQLALRLTF